MDEETEYRIKRVQAGEIQDYVSLRLISPPGSTNWPIITT